MRFENLSSCKLILSAGFRVDSFKFAGWGICQGFEQLWLAAAA